MRTCAFFIRGLFVYVALTCGARSQQCSIDSGEPLRRVRDSLVFSSSEGTATLVGFDEFTNPSSPPKKYRRRTTTGQMTTERFADSVCEGSGSGSYSGAITWGAPYNMSATPIGSAQNPGNPAYVDFTIDFINGLGAGWMDTHLVFRDINGNIVVQYGGQWSASGQYIVTVGPQGTYSLEITPAGGALGAGATGTITLSLGGGGQPEHVIEDHWDKVEQHDSQTGILGSEDNSERLIDGMLDPGAEIFASTPLFAYVGASNLPPARTERTTAGNEQCVGPDGENLYNRTTGTVTETLSDEDTEADAEQRALASATVGTSDTAYRLVRIGNSFGFSKVRFKADFDIPCPGKREFTLTLEVYPHGSSISEGRTKVPLTKFFLRSGVQEVEFEIPTPEKGKDYKFVGIEGDSNCGDLQAGSSSLGLRSVHAHLSLGKMASGLSAGSLRLDAEVITTAFYTPASLVAATGSGVETIRDTGNAVRQVKAPQVLADIITLGAASYEVRFYAANDVGVQDDETGIYAVSGTPFVIYKFENPDAAQSLTERLLITETRGSLVRLHEYAYAASTSTWTLARGNGLRKESLGVTTNGSDTVKTTTIRENDDTVVSKSIRTYRAYAWGEELISEVLDPDGEAHATVSVFYDNAGTDGDNYGRLKQRTYPAGSWERHTYAANRRPLKTVRPFLNSAITDPDSSSRVTDYAYTALADADGDSLPEQLTTVIETTLGTETARSHEIEWSKPVTLGAETFARRTDIRCTVAGAAWDAATNLVTETLTYTAEPFIGRSRRVVNPDGTGTLTTYAIDANGQLTTTVKSGAFNGTLDDVVDGTRTVTFTSDQGQVVGESVTDIASDLTLTAWTATQFDSLGRPTRLDHDDGTYETRDYACCGLASSRDRSGAITSYQYDALGRQTHVTRAGLTTRTAYDAAGRIKSVTRIGDDASEMIQSSSSYDFAGRLTERHDALDRQTTYAEAFNPATGETTRTTTNPDEGTVVEVSARDDSRLSVSGTAAAQQLAYEYGVDADGPFTKEIRVGEAGATTEWVKTYTDFAGRAYKRVYADDAVETSHYNALGQLVRQVDADGVTTLYAYNAAGEQEVMAVDINANGVIDFDGTDRVSRTSTEVGTRDTFTVQRNTTEVWETESQDTLTVVSVAEATLDGLRSWQTVRGLLSTSVATLDGSGGRTIVTTAPDETVTTQVLADDRLQSVVTTRASLGTLSSTTYGYDPHGRLLTQTDARTGATTYAWFADDQLHTVTTPDPDPTQSGPGYDPQTTTFGYDTAGRQHTVTQPDGAVVTTEYYPTGLVKKVSGARTYPVEYTYDPQGRLKTLTTWQDFAGDTGKAVTTWNYHSARGWLDNKRYHDNTGPSYTYKPSGRLHTRTWARGVTTTYSYNAAGDPTGWTYSDTTPSVAIAYDRAGRPKTRTDAAGVCTWTYHANGQLDTETYAGGQLDGLSLDRGFDSLSRLSSLSALSGVSVLNQIGYTYDAASRLDTVTSGANTATYGYLTDSSLVGSVTFKQGGTTRLTTVKTYDNLNRLSGITNTLSTVAALSAAYQYNSANQRTRLTREDNAYWDYGYDALGQVTSAVKKLSGGETIPGLDHGWTFDDIGNRQTATLNAQTATYSPNLLNQYDARTVPGVIEVMGAAQPDATVTVRSPAVNGTIYPTTRQGERFHRQVPVDNSTASQYAAVEITGVKNNVGPNGEDAITEETRHLLVAGTPESFSHDADGNLTGDAQWTYAWDGENRLIGMETSASAITAGAPRVKLEFAYDGLGRRIAKKVYDWDGTDWVLGTSMRFLYDGWNLIAELNALDANAVVRTYAWGLDLSGSAQGAGGVGGLLFADLPLQTTTYAPAFDGNGNVIAYVNLATGAKSATYEYGAFGETLIADGVAAEALPFRFSTKFTDNESGLLYYGLRYYTPGTGRWLNRDPVEENGGVNLYGFVGNSSINGWDAFGDTFTIKLTDLGVRQKKPSPEFANLVIAGQTSRAWGQITLQYRETVKGDCCVRLKDVTGELISEYWYASEKDKQHELRHVEINRSTVASLNSDMGLLTLYSAQWKSTKCITEIVTKYVNYRTANASFYHYLWDATDYTDPDAKKKRGEQAVKANQEAGALAKEIAQAIRECSCSNN